jgi:DNA-binding transcriptional LysR family regulator
MEMQQVRYFLALAQTLNFTRAAEECNVTQPALTRAIQALEAELGGELVRRERQQTHLTELGRRMLPLMQQCYDAALSAKSLAKAVKSSDVAPLPIAISNSVNIGLLSSILSELLRTQPGLRLKIHRGPPDKILEILKRGDAEIAVAGSLGENNWERLDNWPIFEEAIELAISTMHPLGQSPDSRVTTSQLAGEALLGQAACETAAHVSKSLRAKGLSPEASHEVENENDMLALVEVNAGVGFLPHTGAQSPRVRRLSVHDVELRRTVTVYTVAGRRRSPAATAMLNLLRGSDWSSRGVSEPA